MLEDKIIPCSDDCVECKDDIKRYEELINKMSSMHLQHSTDPAILCSASFKDFKKEYLTEHSKDQGQLFEIANRHELSWTQF